MIKAKLKRVLLKDNKLVFLVLITTKGLLVEATLDGKDKDTLCVVKDASAKLWGELYANE